MLVENRVRTKAVVTVSEMARMVGLSRARFYQLMGSTFPLPVYDINSRRPIFVESMQEQCLEVRQRNCGIDGKPVLFYARRNDIAASQPTRQRRKQTKKNDAHEAIFNGVRSLGLTAMTLDQVSKAIQNVFPNGIGDVPETEVIRKVFVSLKRQDSSDNLGR